MVILTIIIISTVELFAGNVLSLGLGRARAAGLALANEKLEYLRDLPYDSLATQHGAIYPAGSISDDEYLTRNNIRFRVHTDISYVDDPFDGNLDGTISGKPKDLYPYDYKKAEITVYTVNGGSKVSTLTTNIGAKAAETSSNTGILRVKVLNANGQAVEDASVHITNTTVSPGVDITTTTDSSGYVVIPKLPPDSGHDYQITVTKSGYSSDQTYADPAGAQTPVLINPNILVQQISDLTFSIDIPGTLNITVVDTSGNPVANLANVVITGAKKIYTSPDAFKYNQTRTTDANGQISLSGIEWDSYGIALPTGRYIVTTMPYQAVSLAPGSTTAVTVVTTTSSTWPRITSVSPTADNTGSPTTVVIKGANFTSGTTVKLTHAGSSDIGTTSATISGQNTITATFNLGAAVVGDWDIVVTNGTGSAKQIGGFSVTP